MPENTNPSVVQGDGPSNYSLSRSGGMQAGDMKFIEDMQKTIKQAPTGALPTSTYYPTAGRSINVGQISSKTLGSVPIFAAGTGLIPIGILEAKRKEEHKAKLEEFAMFGPGNNDILDQYVELANPFAQDEFNSKLQGEINQYMDEAAALMGGDYSKARMYAKYDPRFKNMVRTYQNYARGYNAVFGDALQIIQDAQDPDKRVDEDTLEMAANLIKNHDNLGTKKIEDLAKFVNKFQSHMSIDKAVTRAIAGVGTQITTEIEENPYLSTEAVKAVETIEKTGYYTDAQMNSMIKDELESYPFIKNDPKARALFESKFRNGIKREEKRAVQGFRKEYAENKRNLNMNFGIHGDSGTKTTMFTPDGQSQYNTEYVTIPQKNALNMATAIMYNSNDMITVQDHKGNVYRGHFNTPVKATPGKMYKDPSGGLQVLSSVNVMNQERAIDPLTGTPKSITKGEMMFNVVSGPGDAKVIDVMDFAGVFEVVAPESTVSGQMQSQFGDDVWSYTKRTAENFPDPVAEHRIIAPRQSFITRAESKEIADTRWKGKAREAAAETKEATGQGTFIIEDLSYYNKMSGTWVSYNDMITSNWTPEQLKAALISGEMTYK